MRVLRVYEGFEGKYLTSSCIYYWFRTLNGWRTQNTTYTCTDCTTVRVHMYCTLCTMYIRLEYSFYYAIGFRWRMRYLADITVYQLWILTKIFWGEGGTCPPPQVKPVKFGGDTCPPGPPRTAFGWVLFKLKGSQWTE